MLTNIVNLVDVMRVYKKVIRGRTYYYTYVNGEWKYLGAEQPKWGKKAKVKPVNVKLPANLVKDLRKLLVEAIQDSKRKRHGEWKYFVKIAEMLGIALE